MRIPLKLVFAPLGALAFASMIAVVPAAAESRGGPAPDRRTPGPVAYDGASTAARVASTGVAVTCVSGAAGRASVLPMP